MGVGTQVTTRLLAVLTLCTAGCSAMGGKSPTAQMFRQFSEIFTEVGLDIVEQRFADILPPNFAEFVRILGEDNEGYTGPATCTACLGVVEFATWVNLNGLTYADVRDELIGVCEALFNVSSPQAPLMCPGIMDNYAPHAIEVLLIKPTNNNSREICELFNTCAPETNTTMQNDYIIRHHEIYAERRVTKANKAPMSDEDRARIRQNSVRVVHLTDIHVEERYLEGSAVDCGLIVCCMPEFPGEGEADLYGEYKCNVPPRTTQLFFEMIGNLQPSADFILYTGDSPPHALWLETREGQLSSARWVAETMHAMLPATTAYVTMGNHEAFPSNLYYLDRPETQELNREFFNAWQPMAKWTAEQQQTIEYAGYYTMLARPGLRILAFNSNFGYTFNWYNWINIDRDEYFDTLNFINNTLQRAQQANEKVILIGHHPTGHGDCMVEWGHFMTDVLSTYSDTIVLYVMGHTHDDEFHVVVDPSDGTAKAVEYLSGTANSMSLVNPNARVFYLDPVSFQVLDYDQYILDIEPSPSADIVNLTLSYSASKEYLLPDLTPQSWYDLTFRFEDDAQLFDKYIDNMKARSGDNECNAVCRRNEICSMRSSSADQYEACIQEAGGPGY